jgi:hypothetical protein
MRFDGHQEHDLFIERHPARLPAHCRQKSVIVPFASAKAAALQVKSYSRDQDQVQLL